MRMIFVGARRAVPLLTLFFVLSLFLFFSACGRKGNHVPPEEVVTGKVQLKENHAQFSL